MKKYIISLFVGLFLSISVFSQDGLDCSTAYTVSSNGCLNNNDNSSVTTGTLAISAPSCMADGGNNNGMWFKFLATGPVVNITVTGGTLLAHPMLTLLSSAGNCVSPFTELGCSTSGATSTATLNYSSLTNGNVYYIYIDGANNEIGTFNLCITSPAQPLNDLPCNAITLPTNNFCSPANAYTNANSTQDMELNNAITIPGGCWTDNLGANNGVWFKFIATGNQVDVTVNGFASPLVVVLQIPNDDCNSTDFTNFFARSCGQSTSGTTTTATSNSFIVGQTYFILVDGFNNSTGSFSICLNSYTPTNVLVNDQCSGSIPLCPNTTINGTTEGGNPNTATDPPVPWGSGTVSPATQNACNGDNNYTVYYDFWTTATNSPVTITITPNCTTPNANLLQVGIFKVNNNTPCSSSNWTMLDCDASSDFFTSPYTVSTTSAQTTPNTHYYLVFDSFPNTPCDFSMTIEGNRGSSAGNDETVCINLLPFNLTGFTPSGGTWIGPGITNSTLGTFNPMIAGIGTHLLYYSSGPCMDTKTITVTGPSVNVSNDATICSTLCTTLTGNATQPQTTVTPLTFSSTNPINIPDNSPTGVSSPISVTGLTSATISNVTININHLKNQDLDIYLVCPDGTQLELSTDNGANGDNYTNAIFSTTASININTLAGVVTTPITGSFLPEGSFSSLTSCLTNGQWNLLVVDDATNNVGTIASWSLSFLNSVTTSVPATSFTWSPTTDMTNSNTLSPEVCPIATTEYVLTATDANNCVAKDTVKVNVISCNCSVVVLNQLSVCPGGTINLTSDASASLTNPTYSWSGSNNFSSTVQNPTLLAPSSPGTYTYTVIAQSNGQSCFGTTTVTVNQLPIVNAGNDVSICSGGSTVLNGTGTANSYSWSPANGLSATNSASVTASPTLTTTYTLDGTDANGCTSIDQVIISVNPPPTVNDPTDQVLCSNISTTAIAFTGNSTGVTYNWLNSDATIGLGASGTGDIASFISTNLSSSPVVSTITVTPTLNGCIGTPQDFTITVNPIPTVNDPLDQGLCANSSTTAIQFSGSVPSTTYNWLNSVATIGLGALGTGDIASFTAVNSGSIPVISSLTVTPTLNGCSGTPQSFSITVNPIPTVNDPTDQSICVNAATTAVNYSGNNAGTTYGWLNDNANIGLAANGTGNIPSFTAINTGLTPVTATITVAPTLNGCIGSPQTFTITVNPLPTISAGSDVTICNGQSTTLTASGGVTYVWSPATGLNSTTTESVLANPSATTTYDVIGTDVNGCSNASTVTVTVSPNIPVDAGSDIFICPGESATLTALPAGIFSSVIWNNSVQDGVAFNPTATTTYTVTATTIANGCETTDQVIVSILTPPTVSATDEIICLGDAITLNGSGASTYVWDNGVTDGVSFTPSSTTTYTVTGTDANGCSGTGQVTVTVVPVPNAVFTADVMTGQIVLNVNFTNSSTNATSYVWDFGNGSNQSTNNQNPVSTQYVNEGVYTVTLIASNGLCDDTETLTITAGPIPPLEVEVPNVFTPNTDGSNEGYFVWTKNAASIEAIIVNRWGNTMVVIDDLAYQWDGKTPDGKEASEGVYFLKYNVIGLDGTEVTGHTFFHLVR
jgi:gliding motility-associated-like protein